MDLSDFVETVLVSINKAVDSARSKTSRDIHFANNETSRTVEFDIAVSAEGKSTASGKAGIRVLKFVESGGEISNEKTNSTISRIKFGVDVEHLTKVESSEFTDAVVEHNNRQQWSSFPT